LLDWLGASFYGLNWLRKKSPFRVKYPGKHPSGAKALLILLRFFGTAKAVPFQNGSGFDFFRTL